MTNWNELLKGATIEEVQVRQPAVAVEVPRAVVKVLSGLTVLTAEGLRKVWTIETESPLMEALADSKGWVHARKVLYAGAKEVEGEWSAAVKPVFAAEDEYVEVVAVVKDGRETGETKKVVRVKDDAVPLRLKVTMGEKRGRKAAEETNQPAE